MGVSVGIEVGDFDGNAVGSQERLNVGKIDGCKVTVVGKLVESQVGKIVGFKTAKVDASLGIIEGVIVKIGWLLGKIGATWVGV